VAVVSRSTATTSLACPFGKGSASIDGGVEGEGARSKRLRHTEPSDDTVPGVEVGVFMRLASGHAGSSLNARTGLGADGGNVPVN
jgi:hypothetical protein